MLKNILYELNGSKFIKTIIYEFLRKNKLLNLAYYLRYNIFIKDEYPLVFKSNSEDYYLDKLRKIKFPRDGNINWLKKLKELHEILKKNGFKKFLRNPIIIETMFVTDVDFTKIQYKYLINKLKDDKILYENNIGQPVLSKINKKTSANLIHHAYHYESFMDFVGENIEFENIFEYGGGYGSLARYVIKRNQSIKNYMMYDFNIFNIISEYYLNCLYDHVNFSFLNQDNFDEINKFKFRKSLFISTWAFSESPIELRNKFKSFIKKFDYVLIAYQKK